MRKILITISYDGTNYFGWQKQQDKITIEGEIEKACNRIFVNGCEIIGASRTDRKVHALGQRASIQTISNIPITRICDAINSNLPKDIVVINAKEVDLNFHPRYCAKQKTYEYKIVNDKYMIPQLNNYAEFERRQLDLEKMQKAAKYLIGKHDFKAFCASGNNTKSTERQIYDIFIQKKGNIITMNFTGNGFLYNMIRILTGTLLYVGLGKINYSDIEDIILSKDRTKAGKTVSPMGLTLVEIKY